MLADGDEVIGADMRMFEEGLAVGCEDLAAGHAAGAQGSKRFVRRTARYGGCELHRQWRCVGMASVALLPQRWLWFGAAEGGADRPSLPCRLGHHVDPAVAQAVKAVEWSKPILLLIGGRPLGLTRIAREPGRTQHDSAAQKIAVDALHDARARAHKQGQ